MILKLTQITVAIIIFIGVSYATTFHVSKNGNDNNNGLDWDNAWATISKVNSSISSGDTVFFGTGTWRGRIVPVSGISALQPTVYACSAFTEGIASLWASDSVTSEWVVHSGNIWKTEWSGLCSSPYDEDIICVGQIGNGYDTLLAWDNVAIPDEAGYFYQNENDDSLWVWLYGGGDPNDYDIEASCQPIVHFTGQDHVKFWGFKMRYGYGTLFFWGTNENSDSNYIEHCHLSRVAGYPESNCALINSSASFPINDSAHVTGWDNVVRACSLMGQVFDPGVYGKRYNSVHRFALCYYGQWNALTESCVVIGDYSRGIKYKSSNWHGIIRYNFVRVNSNATPPYNYNGIYATANYNDLNIYGNVIMGNNDLSEGIGLGGDWVPAYPDQTDTCQDVSITNNTIYNTHYSGFKTPARWSAEDPCHHTGNNYFKYNIIYIIPNANNSSYGGVFRILCGDTLNWVSDSNMVYVETGDSTFGVVFGQQVSLSTWQTTYGFDTHSDFVNDLNLVGFTNPAYGDFSRPNASTEMYRTYGGKTWSLYGAWQPDDPLPPPIDSIPPAIIEDLNAIPGDNHGEIILTWTAPGDDGFTGLADHYVIKYSPTAITESNWADFPAVLNPPQPLSPGDSTYFAFDTHEDGHYYYIAIKTYDEVGIASDLSNVAFSFSGGIMVPTQISTETDSVNNSVQLTCTTVESYKSINYLFALDSVSVFSNPELIIDSLANDAAIAVFEGLSDDVNYYWRCCAISTDYTDSSAWSLSIEFNLNFGLISSFAESDCLRPTEGEIVPSSRPYFIVRNPQNIYELYFQVDDNDNFSSPVESGSVPPTPGDETRWQLPATDPIEQGVIYYWRVSNNNAVWTSPISFSALLEIHPYPNPFRASEGHTNITFTNLPQDSSIMISTISGDIILREDSIGPGDWVWDVKNDRGNNLAPGVYLYAINFPSGSSNGKLLIIR